MAIAIGNRIVDNFIIGMQSIDRCYIGQDIVYDKVNSIVYGWHVDPSISDPSQAITYLADAVGMTPAAMGSTTFNYGSWANAFFMPKPCMLKHDGTVAYYLDPNDYTKKAGIQNQLKVSFLMQTYLQREDKYSILRTQTNMNSLLHRYKAEKPIHSM